MRVEIETLSSKAPAEVVPITLDFKNLLASIDALSVSVIVKSGIDNNPAALLYSSAQIVGTQVRQLIQGGIDGVVYVIRMDAASGNEKYAGAAFLPVRDLP